MRGQSSIHAGIAIVVYLLLALALAPVARAEAVTVCPDGGDFSTIQPAIGAANAGDVIELCPATYAEPVRIDKDITLRGAGQSATIISSQTLTTVISLAPDATITLSDLTLFQASRSDSTNAYALGEMTSQPFTGTFTVTNDLDLSGEDQVTTIINGDVSGNVVIIQANTTVHVVNGTFSVPYTDPNVLTVLAAGEPGDSPLDAACDVERDEMELLFAEPLDTHCDIEALELAIQNWLAGLTREESTALAAAAYQTTFGIDTEVTQEGADQVTTIVNGDVSGNLVIVQANTTVDVDNLTITLTRDGSPDTSSTAPGEMQDESHLLFLPVLIRMGLTVP